MANETNQLTAFEITFKPSARRAPMSWTRFYVSEAQARAYAPAVVVREFPKATGEITVVQHGGFFPQ